jgi:hypothetical protein
MGTCRYCGKGGLFRAVDVNGLCDGCRRPVLLSISSTRRVLDESIKLAQTGKTLSTRLGRWDLIVEKAEHLLEFERRGIPTFDPPPSQLIVIAKRERRAALIAGLQEELASAEGKVELAATPTARVNAFAKTVEAIQEARRSSVGDEELDRELQALEEKARTRRREVQLENMLDVARKAQFKGQIAKAIDGYRDVLYELERDPGEHTSEIAALESLISELRPG